VREIKLNGQVPLRGHLPFLLLRYHHSKIDLGIRRKEIMIIIEGNARRGDVRSSKKKVTK
jgi:hypothetical protein